MAGPFRCRWTQTKRTARICGITGLRTGSSKPDAQAGIRSPSCDHYIHILLVPTLHTLQQATMAETRACCFACVDHAWLICRYSATFFEACWDGASGLKLRPTTWKVASRLSYCLSRLSEATLGLCVKNGRLQCPFAKRRGALK